MPFSLKKNNKLIIIKKKKTNAVTQKPLDESESGE